MERFRNSHECIQAGKILVRREEEGEIVPYSEAAEFALNVIETMTISPTIHQQLHDNLYKYVNDRSRIGTLAKIFFDLAKRSAVGRFNVDLDFEVITFKHAQIIGNEAPLISEDYFKSFVDRASQLKLPERW